ncbi:MAG: alpha-L-fucosidase [Phycisphaerae bacterium]
MSNERSAGDAPVHLKNYAEQYARDPHAAAMQWFRDAKLGLFLHYGIYALHGRGEWAMYNEAIPLKDYEKLAEQFTAEGFDAGRITDLALAMGAGYVNLTTKHHDGFCLWDSDVCDFSAPHTPAGRDLVGELAEQCHAKGLGLFVYYSYALDWRHPWFFSLDYFDRARPPYARPEPRYLFEKADDFRRYIDYVHEQLTELLTHYGPVAGVWFDPEMAYLAQPEMFPIDETYALIRRLQPHALISFKHGATGEEDFAAPEGRGMPLVEKARQRLGEEAARHVEEVWRKNRSKRGEICDTLAWSWGYHEKNDQTHKGPDEVMAMLAEADRRDCNLLINTAPLPDGSIPAADVVTLTEVGRRRKAGETATGDSAYAFDSDQPPSTPIT